MVVFTNGCFDILHRGHVDLLARAKALGDKLVVGLNSDSSVRRIKGPGRPYQNEEDRKEILLGLKAVDEVVIFDALTPEELIHQIKPDVLVKGGDWAIDEIIGAGFVTANGGRVVSLPLLDGYSTTAITEKIGQKEETPDEDGDLIERSLNQHIETFDEVLRTLKPSIADCGRLICETVRAGGKILICGNGGSAADAQHIAAEFVGRYESERKALPAIALTTDTSALTAVSNDYGFERVFARQVEALAGEKDCLIAMSTSGNSPNVITAVMQARSLGCKVIGMTGANGKKLASLSDASLLVPAARTARIQEVHITVAHIWCELVDEMIASRFGT
ncbi:MAG TPA: D-sedoheptulose 7-phosphate isomerase [Pyrinomonadaceae bacterium]|nr:D-sedoheptulose 7-phosphate isomerase [Pyrinomonadaceae bacterium]HVQ56280.1 D-sedoheptulose 7-phosphate isomerase [Pyrinomonadaceae bacterium]